MRRTSSHVAVVNEMSADLKLAFAFRQHGHDGEISLVTVCKNPVDPWNEGAC